MDWLEHCVDKNQGTKRTFHQLIFSLQLLLFLQLSSFLFFPIAVLGISSEGRAWLWLFSFSCVRKPWQRSSPLLQVQLSPKNGGGNVQTYKLYKLLRDKELFSAYQFSKHVINVGFGKLALGWFTGALAWWGLCERNVVQIWTYPKLQTQQWGFKLILNPQLQKSTLRQFNLYQMCATITQQECLTDSTNLW